MSWITKRSKPDGTTQWLYRWSANGVRKTRIMPQVKTKREAEKIRRQWDYQRQIEQTITPASDFWTLEKAYQELLKQKNFSPRYEVEFRRFYEKSIFAFFGADKNLLDISVGEIKQWVDWRKKQAGRDGSPVRNTTVRYEFYALSECFQLAIDFNILNSTPCSVISLKKFLPNDAQRRERVLTIEEIEHLLDNSEGHIKTFVILAWTTAGRMSEILQLQWGDLDLEKGTITFHHEPPFRRTKNKKTHCVFVAKKFMEYVVNNHPTVADSPWIFSHAEGSRIQNVKRGLQSAVDRAGLIDVTRSYNSAFYQLHALGRRFFTNRRSGSDGAFQFSHMTSHYAHTQTEERKAAAEYLAEVGKEENSESKGFLEGFPDDKTKEKLIEICKQDEFVNAV